MNTETATRPSEYTRCATSRVPCRRRKPSTILRNPGGTRETVQPVSFASPSSGPDWRTFQSGGATAHVGLTISRSIFPPIEISVNANCSTVSFRSSKMRALTSSPDTASAQNLWP